MYLRGETAQGIFINYKNVLGSGMYSIPFGIAQVGKAFRNEISPRQFLFRKREFEQMEMQYFVSPKEAPAAYEEWKKERMAFYDRLGVKRKSCAGNNTKILSFTRRTPGTFSTSIRLDGTNWKECIIAAIMI